MKEYLSKRLVQEKKISTWVKRIIYIVIGYIINTYYKEEFLTLGKMVFDFLTNNYTMILRGFGIFTIICFCLISIWFVVMLYKVGLDGIDEIFEKGEDFIVKLLKFIFQKIAHF